MLCEALGIQATGLHDGWLSSYVTFVNHIDKIDLSNLEQITKLIQKHSQKYKHINRIKKVNESFVINHEGYNQVKIDLDYRKFAHYMNCLILHNHNYNITEEVYELIVFKDSNRII